MRLIFTRARRASSLAIRLLEGWRAGYFIAPWSHVAIVCADGAHVMDSLAARGGVTAPRTVQSFLEGFADHRIVERVCDPAQEAHALAWMMEQVGAEYDGRGLWSFIVGHDVDEAGRFYCFDFAAAVARRAGIDVSADRTDCFKLLTAFGAA